VGAAQTIPQRRVLSVVVIEVEMMDGMIGCTVDDGHQLFGNHVVAVVDGDGPKVDDKVEAQPHQFVEGEQEDVDVVWKTLDQIIHRMKGVTSER